MYNARRPRLVLTAIIISIIYISFYIPLHILIFQLIWNTDNTYTEYWDCEFLFGAQMFVYMSYVLRTWHSFYDFKLNYQIAAEKWKSILNEKRYKGTSSIYIKYRETLGSSKWTFKILLILPITIWFIAYTIIIYGQTGYNVEYYMIWVAFLYLGFGLFTSIFIIWKTTRDVYDNIYLRGEILLGCVNIVVAIAGELAVLLFDVAGGYTPENDQYQQVFYFCYHSIATISSFLLIVISTQYIKLKIYQRNKEMNKFEEHIKKLTDADESQFDDESLKRRSTSDMSSMLIDLESLISTADGLQCFLDHLANENQLNYLVFAMEVTQFKKDTIPILASEIQYMTQMKTLLTFPETTVPESSIIFPLNSEKSYPKIYMQLFLKYIDPNNAKWHVQISKEHLNAAIETMRRCKSKYHKQNIATSYNAKYTNKCCSCLKKPISSAQNEFTENLLNAHYDNEYEDQKDQLQEYLDVLDDALEDSVQILTESFGKFKETQQFETWLHKLTTDTKLEMLEQFNKRKSVKLTLQKIENNKIVKQWICEKCTLKNKTICVGNKDRPPKKYCNCCGHTNPLHKELHKELNKKVKSQWETIEMKEIQSKYDSKLDENICTQWNKINHNNNCDNKSIENCSRIQRLLLVVIFYESNHENTDISFNEFIHNLHEYNLTKLMEDYEHISRKHCEPFLFELFMKEIGKCDDGNNCEKMRFRNRRNRNRNTNDGGTRGRSLTNEFINSEERQCIEYLNKIHLFLFHSDLEMDEKYDNESELVSSKFMTDVSQYSDDSNKNDICEYGFGLQLQYHTLSPISYFISMKDELIQNEIYKISEHEWNETLAQALLFIETEFVRLNYTANDHGLGNKYGIKEGDLIGIDNIISILFYCNFDDFQREFSNTFRKLNKNDTKQDIINRHCCNFYWYGRSLYVAINYFGKRMNKRDTVWHGLSIKMVFEEFAKYFDSPTSTTTNLLVAQRFSNDGNGIILKLQSKYQNNCSFMLDVSTFSNFTNESERLFLNESLLITDILHVNEESEWISNKIYVLALVFFNKITTGMAEDNDWNIEQNENIQNTLSDIIEDYIIGSDNSKEMIRAYKINIPKYIQLLFKHYCTNNYLPRFNNIHKIHSTMTKRLKMYLFEKLHFTEEELLNSKQKISQVKIKLLFPNAMKYVNDQGNEIIMTTNAIE